MKTDRSKAARMWIRRWHPWVSISVFIAAYLLYAVSNVVGDLRVLIGCGVLVLFSVMERLDDIKSAVNAMLSRMGSEQPLMSMWECLEETRSRLQEASREDKVLIEFLGLDLSHAWDHLKGVIDDCSAENIECRVLIMTDDPAELGPNPPSDVLIWSGIVPSSVAYMTTDVERVGDALKKKKRKIQVSLRKYPGMPCIHGFRVSGPQEHSYISFAGWESPDYSSFGWGGRSYLSMPGSSTREIDQRFSSLFAGAFEHNWFIGSTEVIAYRNFGRKEK